MTHFSCLVQEHGPAHHNEAGLTDRLVAHHARHYPGEHATVTWRPVPAGHMFTEGRQSTSSVISCALPHQTDRDEREAYMRGICDLWTEITGCTDHEILVSLTEVDPATEE